MNLHTDIHTRFAIDLGWWSRSGRDLRIFLADILGEEDLPGGDEAPLDYIDPLTAEVHQLDALWVRVLLDRVGDPDYIGSSTPLATAVLRAFLENLNRPMTVVQLHRRIGRSSPETLLRLMRTARTQYGIVPVANGQGA